MSTVVAEHEAKKSDKKENRGKKIQIRRRLREDLQILLQRKYLEGQCVVTTRSMDLRSGRSTIKGRRVQYVLKAEDAIFDGTKAGDVIEGRLRMVIRNVRRK